MADGSAPKPYTEEDVQLVAEAICDAQNNPQHHPWTDFDWKCEACVSELDSPCSRCAKITRTVLDALAEAGRLRSDEVWIVGTDYADDEIFGVTATRAEAERAAIGHDGDLPLHVVRYTVPYPSRPGGSDG